MPHHSSQPQGLAYSAKARRTRDQPINALIAAAMADPGLINLAAGLVDTETLPVKAVATAMGSILSDQERARAALQYETTQGLAELRKAALEHLEELEAQPASKLGLSPDQVVITTGSQQALYLIGDVLIDPGDIVITSNPSYFVYTAALTSFGANVLAVPADDKGLDVLALDALLARLESEGKLDRVKMVYCTSYFDNPTGLTLALERRRPMVEVVKRFSRSHRIVILEDAAYRELQYDSGATALPSIKSFDPENTHTAIACTFSKPFAPGIKLGYTAMPPDLLHAVLQQKGNHDFGSASLCQHLALEIMQNGLYKQQVQTLRENYRKKRDIMLAALMKYMPAEEHITWTRPTGGLYVWLTLPERVDTRGSSAMFNLCVERGVLYVPGDHAYQPDESGRIPTNHLRLSFGNVPMELIEEGIKRLAGVVQELLSGGNGAVTKAHGQGSRAAGGDPHATQPTSQPAVI